MTLIEGRQATEPRRLGKRPQELEATDPFEESSEEEFLIASEGYPEDIIEDSNNLRDYFSLPNLGLNNYLNNFNLSLNLNLNLRNSSLWRIYENSSFTKSSFFSSYLGKHSDELHLDDDNEISPDSRSFFTITNFLRRHGFPSYEEDYSEEAVLERIRFKKLQQQAAQTRTFESESIISELHIAESESYETSVSQKLENSLEQVDLKQGNLEDILAEEHQVPDKTAEKEEEMQKTSGDPPALLNPFYSRVELSTWDYIKIVICVFLVLPLKLALMVPTLVMALIVVLIGMFGVSIEESQSGPLPAWRRGFRWVLANVVMRAFVASSGFWWKIRETGKRATPEEAPIFVVGPHSSYFDAFVVILLGAPSVVAKLSTKDIPIFGRLVTCTQAVYVSRESKGSRRQTMEVLKQRAQGVYHGSGMPQIFIFPEGTCGNRSSLIKFKAGAFVPSVPVQPVLIRYPNKVDTVTWTFDGPPVKWNILYALTQLYVNIDIEYLPVYVPNEAEKNDPNLYAENVRRTMARSLDIPMSDFQFEDGTLLSNLRATNLEQKLRSIHRAKKALAVSGFSSELTWLGRRLARRSNMRLQQFQTEFFNVTTEDRVVPEVQAVFNHFKKEKVDTEDEERIDIKPYVALTYLLYNDEPLNVQDFRSRLYNMYEISEGKADDENLATMMEGLFEVRRNAEDDKSTPDVRSAGDAHSRPISEEWIRDLPRYIEFLRLFADEVTERIPKTYPPREQRDKPPNYPK